MKQEELYFLENVYRDGSIIIKRNGMEDILLLACSLGIIYLNII